MARAETLKLVRESKIAALLPGAPSDVEHEASGVLVKECQFFVVFDNHTSVAKLSEELVPCVRNGLFGMAPVDGGYEGITYNSAKNRYYLLVESRRHKGGRFRAEIFEYDDALSYLKSRPIEFDFKSSNKGFEAVCHVPRDNRDYLLALCEGNKCQSGGKGRKPGGGRIQIFEKRKKRWAHVDTIKLPKSVLFEDYSGMTIDGSRVAVVSQQNSMLWIGSFEESKWNWCDGGEAYPFPRTTTGKIAYGNVEGVAWINLNRLVAVSDRRKKKQPSRFAEKDQSVHIFDLPE